MTKMVRSQVHVFPTKKAAINYRKKLLKRGYAVGKITKISEWARGTHYKYRLKASKNPVK